MRTATKFELVLRCRGVGWGGFMCRSQQQYPPASQFTVCMCGSCRHPPGSDIMPQPCRTESTITAIAPWVPLLSDVFLARTACQQKRPLFRNKGGCCGPNPAMQPNRNANMFAPFARLREQIDEEQQSLASACSKVRSLTEQLLQLLNQTLSKSSEAISSLRRLTEQLATRLKLHDPRDAILPESKRILQLTGSMWKNQEQSINLQVNSVARRMRGRPRRTAEEEQWEPPQEMMRELPRESRAVAEKIGRELARSESGSVSSEYRMQMQKEFFMIKQFVTQELSKMLEVDETSEIPKKVVLNTYLDWNRSNSRKVLIDDNSRIQMELTNQLKAVFPKVENMRKTFRGLRFKDEHTSQLELTDRAPPIKDDDVFDETDYYDPLEALLKEDPEDQQPKD